MPVNAVPRDAGLDAWRSRLRPGRLRALEAREFLLEAMRFQRVEAEYRAELAKGDEVRIAMLSSLSSQHFISALKLFLYAEGLIPEVYGGAFDGIRSDGLDPKAAIWQSNPHVVVIAPATEDIAQWPQAFSSNLDVEHWVEAQAALYLGVWRSVSERCPGAHVYHGLFVPPVARPLGNLERAHVFSRTNCIARLNGYLLQHKPRHVTLVDLEALSAIVGRSHWTDEAAFHTSKQPFSLRETPLVAAYFVRLIASGRGQVRKCLVLDLDNTLWGGVIGDDGLAGIRLTPDDPVGEAYLSFHRYLLALKERGVILAVCSKNDPAIARSVFEQHPDSLLKLSDFAAFVATWDDKITNLRRIARELNIGLDSLVFFDDNPAERAIVEQYEPDVMVINVPEDPAGFVRALDMSFAFEWPQLTAEDLGRTTSYLEDRNREALRDQFADYDAYLRALEMKAAVLLTTEETLARVAQLINKTNQFNLRTRRYSEEVLAGMLKDPARDVLHAHFQDRLTNYGIMATVVVRYAGDAAFIENWVMSCRAFKRGLEDAMFNAVVDAARARGARLLVGEFVETAKNGYVADLLNSMGLELTSVLPASLPEATHGKLYSQRLETLVPRPHFITTI